MKFTKMSLVAALLIGSSAFAIENTKVSGDANVFYNTSDAGSNDVFEKDASAADIGVNLNLTSDLIKNDMVSVSTGVGATFLTTLGLENNLVSGVWGGAHTAVTGTGASYGSALGGAEVEDAWWINEAWLAVTAGKTTLKAGRMVLDTPLAFTETWSIEKNTFESLVLLNTDIPDTTLVGAYIGNGNGTETFGQNLQSNVYGLGLATGGVVNGDGKFATYGTDGAYAIAAINNSWKPLTVQAWYYDVQKVAQAYWLQADLNIEGILAGAQYSGIDLDDIAPGVDSDVYAFMLGYEMKDTFTAKVSYSQVGNDASAGFNTATNTATAQSKLYTETWWTYGMVTQADTQSYNITLESPVNGMVDLGAYYTEADQSSSAGDNDLKELTLTAGKSFGPLDATVAYINTHTSGTVNIAQVYLTLNF